MTKNFSNNVSKPTGNYESTINEKLSQYSIPTKRGRTKKIEKFLQAGWQDWNLHNPCSSYQQAKICFDYFHRRFGIDEKMDCYSHVSPHTFLNNTARETREKAFSHREKSFPFLSVRCFHFRWQWKHQTSVSSMPTNKDESRTENLSIDGRKKRFNHNFRGKEIVV